MLYLQLGVQFFASQIFQLKVVKTAFKNCQHICIGLNSKQTNSTSSNLIRWANTGFEVSFSKL